MSKQKLTKEEISNRILNKNPNVKVLDIHREKRNSKTRIIVKIKCECGIEFTRELTHLINKQSNCLCGHCTQKLVARKRKEHYNEKYQRMLKRMNFKPLENIDNLFAREYLEVEDINTGFKYMWAIGENRNSRLAFQPKGANQKNFKYNLLKHCELNGYNCKDIITTDGSDNIEVICECGNHFICNYSRFINGRFRCTECATKKSSYEQIFENFLKDNNIEYKFQYRIASCKNIKPLPFDFLICEQRILVEIQGVQHYKPVKFRCHTQEEAEENFEKQKIRDNIKKEFCKEKDIPLLIISYKEILDRSFESKTIDFIQTHTK